MTLTAVNTVSADDFKTLETQMIDIGRLMPNPLNPRGEVFDDDVLDLMRSIKEKGLLQPLLVTPYRSAFYIVAGHRRRHAARLAGLTKLPCVVRNYSEEEQQELMLVENIQRQNLTPMQEARAFQRLLLGGRASVNDIVQKVGVSDGYVTTRLSILRLDKAVQQMFELQLLPVGAAPILSLTDDAGRQRHYATLAVQRQIPLHKLELMIREAVDKPKKAPGKGGKHNRRAKVLGTYEVFTRSEALHELDREGQVNYSDIALAFNDICDGICVEEDGSRQMCEACPAPRLVASLLRRSGVEIKSRGAATRLPRAQP
jgi:ParB family transcriptional regulator, chromosome partitioning protein